MVVTKEWMSLNSSSGSEAEVRCTTFSVYSESDEHAYSHHEILLSSFPLALEWMDYDPEEPDKKGEMQSACWAVNRCNCFFL